LKKTKDCIKTISYLARNNLIHSAIHWLGMNDLELWPFAFDHCVYLYNNMPSQDGLAPEEKWTGVKFHNYSHLRQIHPWGCPAYVLDPKLQDGKKLPKWSPRSCQGKFVGLSTEHAANVALILNPSTKRISPQFHVLFDDFYTTVRSVDDAEDPVLTSNDWNNFISLKGSKRYFDEDKLDMVPPVSEEWLEPTEIRERQQQQSQIPSHRQREMSSRTDKLVINLTDEPNVDNLMESSPNIKQEEDQSQTILTKHSEQ
jgi:hypothetical protein